MADDKLSESLATAVADHIPIDWSAQRDTLQSADPEFIRSLRVISAIGRARRADLIADQQRGAQALFGLSAAVTAVAAAKVALACVGAIAGWSVIASGALPWPSTLNVLLFGLSGILLVGGGTRDRRVQALGVLFLIIASAFAGPLLVSAGHVWKTGVSSVSSLYADAFLALALWQFVWLFPNGPKQPRARKIGRFFLIASTIVAVALFVANALLALPVVRTEFPVVATVLRVLDRTSSTLLYWPLLFSVAAPAIPYLVWKSRLETAAERRRVTWFVASLGLGLSPILLAVLLTPLFPVLGHPQWRARIGVVLYIALASIVPSTAYAVAVKHVLDLHLVIRRTIQYGLARTSVWCAIVGPLVYLAFDIYEHRQLTMADYLSVGRLAPLALSCVSFVILTFRHQILQSLDRLFLREATDYTKSLARLERDLRTTRTIRDISGVLEREIEQAVHPKSVAVLMLDDERGQLVSLESVVPPLTKGSALLDLLRSVRTEVQLSYRANGAVAGLLPPGDRQWLSDTGFGLFSPLLGSTGTLLGVVGIGEGRNGLPYTERDNMLITAMSGQAALKLENIRLRERSAGTAARPDLSDAQTVDWENEPAARCPECATMWTPTTTHCSCGVSTVEAALPLVVKGKFRVDRFIGAGGTGVVYLAVDMALDRKVAIKTLPAIRLAHASRLHREARAMANVLHPNLALIYGAEQWKGTPLLIFEYLEGGTLLDSLRRGPIALDEVKHLGTLLADALDRVHGSGILHRDIKPSNIGYTSDGVPKLLDFGLAAILDRSRAAGTPPAVLPTDPGVIAELAWGAHPTASLTITQQLVGTPLYLSPEALAGRAPEPSFDLWSLSLVLYEAFAGRHPLAGEPIVDVVRTIQRGTVADIRDFRPDCPAVFAAFLNDALSPVAARRPATAAALRTRLRWLQGILFPQAI